MKEFNIRAGLPKATILNKSVFIGLAAVVVFILLWVLIEAFVPSAKKDKSFMPMNGLSTKVGVSPVLKGLPQNYQDVSGIRKYLSQDQNTSPLVTDELNKLHAEEATLKAQLAQLSQHTSGGGGDDAAIKSDLFFSQGKPPSSLMDPANPGKTDASNMSLTPNTSYNQQNMQAQKNNFLQAAALQGDVYNRYKMITPASPYEVQAGTILAANLLTAINTALPGDIVAQVRQDVYDTVTGKFLLIPKGSKLLGKYDSSIAYGQERILIAFDRIVRPDGTSIQLSNFTGSDEAGSSGFTANVDNHWSRILGAATISTMLSFGAGVAASNSGGNGGQYMTPQQSGIAGAGGSVSQTGQTITNRSIDIQPTLTVPSGFNFNVIVNKDMVLQPYAGKTL